MVCGLPPAPNPRRLAHLAGEVVGVDAREIDRQVADSWNDNQTDSYVDLEALAWLIYLVRP